MAFYGCINPDDSHFRAAPKIGDIYFVDYHQVTRDEKYAGHPYRIARLVSFSDKELELKVSSWSHSKKWGVIRDFSTQMYAYKSNYMANTVTLDVAALRHDDEVISIRRKVNNEYSSYLKILDFSGRIKGFRKDKLSFFEANYLGTLTKRIIG